MTHNSLEPVLNHWHPVLLSKDLGHRPVGLKILGKELVLFRTQAGKISALVDRCCHRGMRLSLGRVETDELVCPYHAWRYDCHGQVTSPSTPQLKARIEHFETAEKYGVIWLRRPANSLFPEFDMAGYEPVCALSHHFAAPLELVLDNFCEVEHTPATHTFFGYSLEQLQAITTQIQVGATSISVSNQGIQRPLPWLIERGLNIRAGDTFFDDWTTYFSPVYGIYDHWWKQRATGERNPQRWRLAILLTPIDAHNTQVFTLFYSTRIFSQPVFSLVKPVLTFLLDYELKRDRQMLENLADQNPDISAMQLGRFDRVLVENRRKLAQLYYQTQPISEVEMPQTPFSAEV
ncbi:Rieske 2Fe-2S domain-containing protein [Sphaerothrix gracilis]|uniref:Rieske 2Fe-2S domain-containing protein n=1 Tax=Sphaerothrix gracilis TaxID=3151835 RepID=UPI0031FC5B3C